eukprot:TRINITY_DN1236_c0_g1_i13.p2 TRINITY_DN1236_c0_g1~~TRINITY_DN1236_c0_g1_i13.p2  ORF type:complete len:208 (-),score=-13.44 TRINITY_DN1236_c0_g1_i13:129-752(-)
MMQVQFSMAGIVQTSSFCVQPNISLLEILFICMQRLQTFCVQTNLSLLEILFKCMQCYFAIVLITTIFGYIHYWLMQLCVLGYTSPWVYIMYKDMYNEHINRWLFTNLGPKNLVRKRRFCFLYEKEERSLNISLDQAIFCIKEEILQKVTEYYWFGVTGDLGFSGQQQSDLSKLYQVFVNLSRRGICKSKDCIKTVQWNLMYHLQIS